MTTEPDHPLMHFRLLAQLKQRNIFRVPVEIDLAMTEPMPNFEPIPSPI